MVIASCSLMWLFMFFLSIWFGLVCKSSVVDDCVYYPTKDTFEIADRQALLLKGEPISISQMFKSIKYPGIISVSHQF